MSCVLHTGYCQPDGYGQKKYKGKVVQAHRLAYALANDVDVFSMGGVVMHSCDTPSCVNPEHLSLGTVQYNVADMLSKGREYSKLSLADAEYIREHYVHGTRWRPGNASELAEVFGVHRSTIVNAATGVCRCARTTSTQI